MSLEASDSNFVYPTLAPLKKQKGMRLSGDAILAFSARAAALTIVAMLGMLLIILVNASIPAIKSFGLGFITSTEWRPNELEQPKRDANNKIVFNEDNEMVMVIKPPEFGALPVIYGTAVSSAIALIFAIPLSFGSALFLVRICPNWLKGITSFLIEFLAAIPSIAYGIWGLFVLCPLMQSTFEPAIANLVGGIPGFKWLVTGPNGELALTGRDMLSGGLILGIMILPIITAISRDVLNAVPRAQIEGTLALGATWWQSAKQMLSYSRSGLFGAIMLGLARAAGETMAVTMVIGNNNQIAASVFAPAQTMSSLLANEFREANSDIHRSALTEVALILLVMSLAFNIVARWLVVGKNSSTAAH